MNIINILCNSCLDNHEDYVAYEFSKQIDDFVELMCPKCRNRISYDGVKAESIKILDWLYEKDNKLYSKIIKSYFGEILDLE